MAKSKKTKHAKPSSKHPYRKPSREIPKSKAATSTPRPRQATIPFSASDRILLVGEGDFSFATSLLKTHTFTSLLATSFDILPTLTAKYPQGASNLESLTAAAPAVQVLHGVDATKLGKGNGGGGKKIRQSGPYDKIVFNFPHTGGLTTDVERQIRANQELLVGFLRSCVDGHLLRGKGEEEEVWEDDGEQGKSKAGSVLVTLFEGDPYERWNIRDLARHVGLRVRESFKFPWEAYPGYAHRRTGGNESGGKNGWKGEERNARTYVFEIGNPVAPVARKREGEDDD
ncbi:MAG: hypothetical protein MMC33_003531 [Icmadophila ericetorum]|nr:hypothetical protein [Icmadophila ericetorum]